MPPHPTSLHLSDNHIRHTHISTHTLHSLCHISPLPIPCSMRGCLRLRRSTTRTTCPTWPSHRQSSRQRRRSWPSPECRQRRTLGPSRWKTGNSTPSTPSCLSLMVSGSYRGCFSPLCCLYFMVCVFVCYFFLSFHFVLCLYSIGLSFCL